MNLNLNGSDYAALSPLLILLVGALAILLIESFSEKLSKRLSFFTSLATLVIALIAGIYAPPSSNPLLTPWLRFDWLSHFFTLFFLVVGIGFLLLSLPFLRHFKASHGEYFFLLLSCLFGLILIAAAADFLTIFLGLETLSIALYILCGYVKAWKSSNESSIKYFLMGSIAAALLLYGIALIYGATGTTTLSALMPAYQALSSTFDKTLFFGGVAFVTFGFAFKATLVPFHAWAPDVYAGAPTPVTAFMAVGTKAGAFAAFIRVFMDALPQFDLHWSEGVAILIYLSLVYANFVALRQTQLRRFFAYSGISHAAFLLIPVVVGGPQALSALLFYLVIYALATFGSFAILTMLEENQASVTVQDLHGLFRRSPLLAGVFAFCFLTLAGIPPTAGFFAKFFIFKVAFEAGYYGLVFVALLTAVLAAYYYLRIIAVMFTEMPAVTTAPVPRSSIPKLLGATCLVCLLLLSFYPAPLLFIIERMS